MVKISDQEFEQLVSWAIDKIPELYQKHLENMAFIVEDQPTPQQRVKLHLYPNETLFGLYEGVPLPRRGGVTKILPDKITIFKEPILAASQNLGDLKEKIYHTIWHETAHYFGLDHKRIHELE
jgi:predicted Zn-dependent protease with MMP-like domain